MMLSNQKDSMGRRGYPEEFRQRVLDLVAAGRRVGDIARDLGISDQTIYGLTSTDALSIRLPDGQFLEGESGGIVRGSKDGETALLRA